MRTRPLLLMQDVKDDLTGEPLLTGETVMFTIWRKMHCFTRTKPSREQVEKVYAAREASCVRNEAP